MKGDYTKAVSKIDERLEKIEKKIEERPKIFATAFFEGQLNTALSDNRALQHEIEKLRGELKAKNEAINKEINLLQIARVARDEALKQRDSNAEELLSVRATLREANDAHAEEITRLRADLAEEERALKLARDARDENRKKISDLQLELDLLKFATKGTWPEQNRQLHEARAKLMDMSLAECPDHQLLLAVLTRQLSVDPIFKTIVMARCARITITIARTERTRHDLALSEDTHNKLFDELRKRIRAMEKGITWPME